MSKNLRVAAAFLEVENGMGQQIADASLIAALQHHPGLDIAPYPVGPLRTRLNVRRRLALGRLDGAPFTVKRIAGAVSYPRTLVHRFDCRLPPAPREVVTVQDLAPLRFPDEGRWPRHVGASLRRARAVVCPSQFSADEVRNEYGVSNVVVIPHGLDPAFAQPEPLSAAQLRHLGIGGRFVLHTGGATMRKNLAALAAAWPAVRSAFPDVELVLCGPNDSRRLELFDGIASTRLLGKVARPTLVSLMATASVVVVPSTYEGYGLPAAEAMACGVPVVAARCASLPEVVGKYGLLVEPDTDGLVAGLSQALTGVAAPMLAEARDWARSRTWELSATRHADIYRWAAGREKGQEFS